MEHGGLIAQSLLGGWRAAGARALLENAVLGGIDRGRDPPSFGFLHVSARSCMGDVSVSFSLRFRGRHCGRDSITGLGRPEVRRPRPARTERLRGAKESMMRSIVL